MKLIFRLKHRELNTEHMSILMDYINQKINWLDAHNKLIPLGIRLNEDNSIVDY